MLSGELFGRNALSGEIQKQVIATGSGTSDYEELDNKPQINGVELVGNKTAEDLGLANKSDIPVVPTKVSAFENDAGYVTANDVKDKADKSYVDTKVADLVNSAPETLDTLGEVAKAIQDNESVVEALNSAIKNKADINTSEFAKEFVAGASAEDISSVYTWDKITSPDGFTQRQRACIYGNGYYVIAGTGGQVVYSKDGVNWFMLPSFTTGIITGLAYGNGYFLAVDSNGGIYRTDIPLNTWTNVHTFTGIIEAIRYINNTFVAVGENGFIGVSLDGKTWNEKQSGTISNIIDVTYGDGKYVAVGAAGTVLTSVNAEIWYPQTIEGHTTDIRTVCYANGMFVMGTSGGRIDYSENGETWLQANNPSANTISWIRAFSYSNNRLYTVMYTSSGAGEIWLSKDKGASWEVAQTTAGRLWCVTFGEDKFITSGDNGAIYVLDLNVEWSKTPIDAEYKWYRFKTTQNNGNIIYSDAYYDSSASLETVETMVGDINTALETILGV